MLVNLYLRNLAHFEKKSSKDRKEIFNKIIAVASGEKSKSEINGYGDDEFNPWIIDPTL